jgi:Family of unknown function (DUF6308)
VEADLADADPEQKDGLFGAAANLFWHFISPQPIRGVRVAKVHKVLHRKRAAVYPILDSRIRRLYREAAAKWIKPLAYLGELTLDDPPPYWAAIGDDLIKCRDELARYRLILASDTDESARSLARLGFLIHGWSTSSSGRLLKSTDARAAIALSATLAGQVLVEMGWFGCFGECAAAFLPLHDTNFGHAGWLLMRCL